jgi:hypothetical protein
VTTHRRTVRRQEGVGATGVVDSNVCQFLSSQASTAVSHSPGPPYNRVSFVSGSRCFKVPPAAATWQEVLAAPWLLLQEVGSWPAADTFFWRRAFHLLHASVHHFTVFMDLKPLPMCHACHQCQRGKICKQPAAPLHSIPVPTSRWT